MNARIPAAALVELTDDQYLIARLFGLMDDRRQGEALSYAAGIAEAFPRTGSAPCGAMNAAYNWTKAVPGSTPDSDRDALVWDGVDCMPSPAFYDAEECCWFSKHDGARFNDGAVTHWREIEAPAGGAV